MISSIFFFSGKNYEYHEREYILIQLNDLASEPKWNGS